MRNPRGGQKMIRRNFFIVGALLSLIVSAAFSLRTSNAGDSSASVSSWPPDVNNYKRPAIAGDVAVSGRAKGGFSSPGFFINEVPDSAGGEPDIAINPLNPKQIVIHAGFLGWFSGNAPNFVSNDGGVTWTTKAQIPPPTGIGLLFDGPDDITQDWGQDGILYGTYLAADSGLCLGTDTYSASNTNPITGGLFSYFLSPAQLTNFGSGTGCSDQPWLLTNKDPVTAAQTNTYVAYDDFGGAPDMRVSVATGTSPPNFVTDNLSGFSTGGINPGHRLATDSRTGFVYDLW